MFFQAALSLLILCLIPQNISLLFNENNNPAQTTTLGPLERDATILLLVKNVLDLEARVNSQEQEIKALKRQKSSKENVTTVTLDKLLAEYIDLKLSFGIIKHKLDQNNNKTGLQTIEMLQNNMAQSIRHLTLSLQNNEVHDKEANTTIHQKFEHLKSWLLDKLQNAHNEIQIFIGNNYGKDGIYIYEPEIKIALDKIESALKSLQKQRSFIDIIFDEGYNTNKIRLMGGGDFLSGRVEVMQNGTWGTVCGDHFDNNAAKVVCRMIGMPTENAVAYGSAQFGPGTGPIIYDDLVCTGNESDLSDCRHAVLDHTNCHYSKDVGVSCR